jgi:hypothetical protein
MIEQILLNSGSFDGVRETGGFGQPLHALYPQIRAVLASELEPDAAWLLAEPVVDRGNNRIDWYTQGDPDHKPAPLSELPDEQRRALLARVDNLLGRGRGLAERYVASDDSRRAQLGAILRAVLVTPAETEVFLVDGRPVITGWGFALDRPWEAPAGSVRRPIPSAEPVGPARDVAVPEIAIPELATAAPESTPLAESPGGTEQPVQSLPLPLPESATEPSEPPPEPPATATEETTPPGAESESPPEPEAAPVATVAGSPRVPEASPTSPLRYVVVGSGYFWGVVAVAILLVLLAAYWELGRERSSPPIAGETARSTVDMELDSALTQAQQDETALRVRLEQLLVQLAGRRGQCPLPTGSDAAAVVPAPGREDVMGTIPTPLASREELSPAIPAGNDSGGQEPAAAVSAADRVAIPSTPPSQESSGTLAEVATAPPTLSPERRIPPAPATQPLPTNVANPLDVASPPPVASASRAPAGGEPPGRTLEEVLTGRESMPTTPLRRQPPAELPSKAEPTPEERQEFASRMSETGATTGEITATLLWNSQSDLDLVVRCPSGRQLDFRNPAECGGTLDVDANTARGSLSDRPVENAFWPAGKAGPGTYEIAVRYIPRKDEERPRETPFQVRLSRGGQESVFKGTIRPNAVVPITTFTVER